MKIKIGLLQMNVEMGNPRTNFAKAKSMIEQAMEKEPDVLVLPETWDCGFSRPMWRSWPILTELP